MIGDYGLVEPTMASSGVGIPGGIGGGADFEPRTYFYVGVPDVEEALRSAEALGGRRVHGPVEANGELVVALFTDPEGQIVGLASVT